MWSRNSAILLMLITQSKTILKKIKLTFLIESLSTILIISTLNLLALDSLFKTEWIKLKSIQLSKIIQLTWLVHKDSKIIKVITFLSKISLLLPLSKKNQLSSNNKILSLRFPRKVENPTLLSIQVETLWSTNFQEIHLSANINKSKWRLRTESIYFRIRMNQPQLLPLTTLLFLQITHTSHQILSDTSRHINTNPKYQRETCIPWQILQQQSGDLLLQAVLKA